MNYLQTLKTHAERNPGFNRIHYGIHSVLGTTVGTSLIMSGRPVYMGVGAAVVAAESLLFTPMAIYAARKHREDLMAARRDVLVVLVTKVLEKESHSDEVNGMDANVLKINSTRKDISDSDEAGDIKDLTVDQRRIFGPDSRAIRIDFQPRGSCSFDASKMTDSLLKGIDGLTIVIEMIESGALPSAPLIGSTNLRMAIASLNFGFRIVDQDRSTDGRTKHSDKDSVTVVGYPQDIRAKIDEFRDSGAYEKLKSRARRLSEKPQHVYLTQVD